MVHSPKPATPQLKGSSTPWAKAVVTAASTALPPCSSTATPISTAVACGATIIAGIMSSSVSWHWLAPLSAKASVGEPKYRKGTTMVAQSRRSLSNADQNVTDHGDGFRDRGAADLRSISPARGAQPTATSSAPGVAMVRWHDRDATPLQILAR